MTPRATAPDLLRRDADRPARGGAGSGGWRRAPTPATSPGSWPRATRIGCDARIGFAIGAKRIAPLWRLLAGVAEQDWHDAIGMDGAQVAVAGYCPDWWPADTRLLIRRVALDPEQVSADPRSRRRRTLHPDQRALPFPELARAGAIYAYSFILTNLDVLAPDKAAAVEHWYRHRTTVENIFRDSKLGAALRHLPSGYPQVNLAWMWGALLAASMAAWLHQLTAVTAGQDILAGHGVRGGKVFHDRHPAVAADRRPRPADPPRTPPGTAPSAWPLGASRGAGPAAGTARPRLTTPALSPGSPSLPTACQPRPAERPAHREPSAGAGPSACRYQEFRRTKIIYRGSDQLTALFAESGLTASSRSRSHDRGGRVRAARTELRRSMPQPDETTRQIVTTLKLLQPRRHRTPSLHPVRGR